MSSATKVFLNTSNGMTNASDSESNIKFRDNIDEFVSTPSSEWKKSYNRKSGNLQIIISKFEELSEDILKNSKVSSAFSIKSNNRNPEFYAKKIHKMIKNTSYEDGQLSLVDHELKMIYEGEGESFLHSILNSLWRNCFTAINQAEHAQFLNCIQNISYYMDPSVLLPYAVAATAHKNIQIKETGIATFEKWDMEEHKSILESIDTAELEWLEDYRLEVIANLGA